MLGCERSKSHNGIRYLRTATGRPCAIKRKIYKIYGRSARPHVCKNTYIYRQKKTERTMYAPFILLLEFSKAAECVVNYLLVRSLCKAADDRNDYK